MAYEIFMSLRDSVLGCILYWGQPVSNDLPAEPPSFSCRSEPRMTGVGLVKLTMSDCKTMVVVSC